jgi:hypothetical protein
MKPSSFSKIFTTVGLMTALSTGALSNAARMAQAQTEGLPEGIQLLTEEQLESRRADDIEQNRLCTLALQEDGEENERGDGYFFDDFRGLTLTDAQRQAYDALDAQAEAQRAALYEQTVAVADPTAILSFLSGFPGTVQAPPDVQDAIQADLDLNPKMDQEAALNQKYGNGQYGFFVGSYLTYLTPEQEAQLAQISDDFYSGVQALMTPEQLPQYNQNLAARLRINAACDARYPISSYPALGRIIELPDANES